MWNYRVVRKKHTWIDPSDNQEKIDYTYAIHEAYYDSNGYVGHVTEDPVKPFGNTIEELRHDWMTMAEAFGYPLLDYDQIPEPGYDRNADPIGSVDEEQLQETRPLEEGLRKLEEEEEGWEPWDEEAYRKQQEHKRIAKEKLHGEVFIWTPTFQELIKKLSADYQAWTERNRTEDPRKDEAEDA